MLRLSGRRAEKAEFSLSQGTSVFFLPTDRMRSPHITEGHLFYSKFTALNVHLIQNIPSQQHPDWCWPSRYYGLAKLTHKLTNTFTLVSLHVVLPVKCTSLFTALHPNVGRAKWAAHFPHFYKFFIETSWKSDSRISLGNTNHLFFKAQWLFGACFILNVCRNTKTPSHGLY